NEAKSLRLIPVAAQIIPLRISGFDQRHSLRRSPGFYFLLASDSIAHVFKHVRIHQAINVVLGSKPWNQLLLVFFEPAPKIVGDASVKRARGIRDYVHVIMLFSAHDSLHIHTLIMLSSRAKRRI